jgi:hypothetical protein
MSERPITEGYLKIIPSVSVQAPARSGIFTSLSCIRMIVTRHEESGRTACAPAVLVM